MAKYINADELINQLDEFRSNADNDYADGKNGMIDVARILIAEMPSADVVEAKHGEWKEEPSIFPNNPFVRCSKCGEEALLDEYGVAKSNFCPNCGADMRGEKEVIRCKDCIHKDKAKVNSKGFLICPASRMEIYDDDYCSYGERRKSE